MTNIELPLAFDGHVARLWARLTSTGGWDVRAEVDDRLVASRYCSDWRGVERFRTWMESQLWNQAGSDPSTSAARRSAA